MYNKLPVKERIELMKSYRKANKDMSYRDMVKDYNDSYEKFDNGGYKSEVEYKAHLLDPYSAEKRSAQIAWLNNNKPITYREDFKPGMLSNIPGLSSLASGNQFTNNRYEMYGPLGDLYRYYGGQPLAHNVLVESKNKPSNAKDKNAKYISLNNDPTFVNEILDNYKRVSFGNLDKGIENKLSNNSWAVSGYSSAGPNAHKTTKQGSEHHSNAIGRYTLSKGTDEKGDYISYYDKFDQGTGSSINPGEILGLTKPFEIYDRIYIDSKTGKPIVQKQRYGGVQQFRDGGKKSVNNNLLSTTVRNDNMLYNNGQSFLNRGMQIEHYPNGVNDTLYSYTKQLPSGEFENFNSSTGHLNSPAFNQLNKNGQFSTLSPIESTNYQNNIFNYFQKHKYGGIQKIDK